MLTASSFAKVSGKLGALGKPLGLTAEMASVTMLPGPIEVRNHHSSAQSSSWGRMGWGKAALAPASSECSHQHFSLLSNIHPKKGPFASCPCQLFIYYKMHDFFLYFLHFLCPSPNHFFSYSHFNSAFTSDYLPQNTSKYSACGKCYPQNPTYQQPGEIKSGQARKVIKVLNSECFQRSCRYLDTSRLKKG